VKRPERPSTPFFRVLLGFLPPPLCAVCRVSSLRQTIIVFSFFIFPSSIGGSLFVCCFWLYCHSDRRRDILWGSDSRDCENKEKCLLRIVEEEEGAVMLGEACEEEDVEDSPVVLRGEEEEEAVVVVVDAGELHQGQTEAGAAVNGLPARHPEMCLHQHQQLRRRLRLL
jgi:hypothetical protein